MKNTDNDTGAQASLPIDASETVRVRILVAVQATVSDGIRWDALGWRDAGDNDVRGLLDESVMFDARVRYCWVEADVPVPGPVPTVDGEASSGEPS